METNKLFEFNVCEKHKRRNRRCSNGVTMADLPTEKGKDRKYWKKKPVHKDWFEKCDENERLGKIKRKKTIGIKDVISLQNQYSEVM